MPRTFSIPHILKQVPAALWKVFFDRLDVHLPISWDTLNKDHAQLLLAELQQLSKSQYDLVEARLHDIFDLSCDTGIESIIRAADLEDQQDFTGTIPEKKTRVHKVVHTFLNAPNVLDTALLLHEVQFFHWWRKRTDLPKRPPDMSDVTRQAFAAELSILLMQEQGRGRFCTVDSLVNNDTIYFFLSPDDYVQHVTCHDDRGKLHIRAMGRTFSIVLAFRPTDGTLELHTQVGPKLKAKIEILFAKHFLQHPLGAWVDTPAYDLSPLARPNLSFATDPEDGITFAVKKVRWGSHNSDRKFELQADTSRADDLKHMIEEVLKPEATAPHLVKYLLMTLEVTFEARKSRRAGSCTFDIVPPRNCGLRNQKPERFAAITKYLRRWGFDVTGQQSSPSADSGTA